MHQHESPRETPRQAPGRESLGMISCLEPTQRSPPKQHERGKPEGELADILSRKLKPARSHASMVPHAAAPPQQEEIAPMRSSDKKEEWSGLDGDGDGMRSERMAAKFGGSVLPGGVSRSRYCALILHGSGAVGLRSCIADVPYERRQRHNRSNRSGNEKSEKSGNGQRSRLRTRRIEARRKRRKLQRRRGWNVSGGCRLLTTRRSRRKIYARCLLPQSPEKNRGFAAGNSRRRSLIPKHERLKECDAKPSRLNRSVQISPSSVCIYTPCDQATP